MTDKPELDRQPEHIRLAIDLIMLLENNNIKPETALQALAIVSKDFETKLNNEE